MAAQYLTRKEASEYLGVSPATLQLATVRKGKTAPKNPLPEPDKLIRTGGRGRPAHAWKKSTLLEWAKTRNQPRTEAPSEA